MQLSSLYRQLQSVGNCSGPIAKQHVLKAIGNPYIKAVLDATYNKQHVYGLRAEIYYDKLFMQGQVFSVSTRELDWDIFNTFLGCLKDRSLTGNAAHAAFRNLIEYTTLDTQLLAARILNRDLDIGISAVTINKVFADLIPVCAVQLAKDLNLKKLRFPCQGEVKYDGKRSRWMITADSIKAYSRNDKLIEGYDDVRQQLSQLIAIYPEGLMLDGELMFGMFGNRTTSGNILRVYDCMSIPNWDNAICTELQDARTRRVHAICTGFNFNGLVQCTEFRTLNNLEELYAFYNEVVEAGGEGIMVKDIYAPYEFKRSHAWMKVKPVKDIDLPIVDVFEGLGKYEGMLGGIIVDHKGVKVRVGAGFTDDERFNLWNGVADVRGGPESGGYENGGWCIGLAAEIRYTEVTPDGSLRFPRFVKLRDDK